MVTEDSGKNAPKKWYRCDVVVDGVKCSSKYENPGSLGYHKLIKHNIHGSSKSALKRQAAKAKFDAKLAVKEEVSEVVIAEPPIVLPPTSTKPTSELVPAHIERTEDGLYICPECKKAGIFRTYNKPTGLGAHRRSHGVQGSSYSVVHLRRQREKAEAQIETGLNAKQEPILQRNDPIQTMDIQPNADGQFECPECSSIFRSRQSLSVHRSAKHHVVSTTESATRIRLERKKKNQAKKKGSEELSLASKAIQHHGMNAVVSVVQGEIEYGIHTGNNSNEETAAIPEYVLALAFAKCEAHIDYYAKTHDCPNKELTQRVAELLLSQARR